MNYSLFALHPLGWHAGAIALHLVATYLVYLVARNMTGRSTVGWLTALIFGLHPIHHEVVAWISGTTESLFAVLFLAAFLAYLKSRETSRLVWMTVSSCGCYALAMLSKETAIVLPALVFAHSCGLRTPSISHLARNSFWQRMVQGFKVIAPYFPVGLGYLVVRYMALSGFGHAVFNRFFSQLAPDVCLRFCFSM